jgi:hypothetical protein
MIGGVLQQSMSGEMSGVGVRLVGVLASPTRADVASRVQRQHLEKRLIVWRFMGDDDKVAGHFVPSELTGERSIP